MPFSSKDGTCTIYLDDLEWLSEFGAGALIRHPNGKLNISCAPDTSSSEPSSTWTLDITASNEKALKEEVQLTCNEIRNAGNEALEILKEHHPTWTFPEI